MRIFCPDQILASVLDIDMRQLSARGIKGFLIDLDNTLVSWDSDEIEGEFFEWMRQAKGAGFQVCLVSNGLPERVSRFAKLMDIPAVSKALKPRRRPFYKGLRLLDLSAQHTAMIGDQLFTDVLGGNRLGLHTILINPLSKKELKSTKVVRRFERRILRRLARQGHVSAEALNMRHGGVR